QQRQPTEDATAAADKLGPAATRLLTLLVVLLLTLLVVLLLTLLVVLVDDLDARGLAVVRLVVACRRNGHGVAHVAVHLVVVEAGGRRRLGHIPVLRGEVEVHRAHAAFGGVVAAQGQHHLVGGRYRQPHGERGAHPRLAGHQSG